MNPFDEDVDDFVFLNKSKGPSASPWSDEKSAVDRSWLDDHPSGGGGGFGLEEEEDDMGVQNIQNQIQQRQDNMLQSTQRSMGLIHQSEAMGNETAHVSLIQKANIYTFDKNALPHCFVYLFIF